MAIADVAAAGDRLATLEVLRDRLAQEIDDCTTPRELPALVLRLTDVLSQIDDMPNAQRASRADEIAERRASRGGSGSAHQARSKRPG